MKRRSFVSATGAAFAAAATGCVHDQQPEESTDETDDGDGATEEGGLREIPVIEDPPDRVYRPTHVDQMEMLSTVEAGDLNVAPMYTLPHRFWLVNGSRREEVVPSAEDTLHFMFAVWDGDTGTVLSEDLGASMEISRDGEVVASRNPWTMISQPMGFHYGDNVPLEGTGGYDVEIELGSLTGARKTGELDGRFTEPVSAEFSFEVTDETLRRLVDSAEYFPEDRWGAAEALPPMGGHGDDGGQDEEHGSGEMDGDGGGENGGMDGEGDGEEGMQGHGGHGDVPYSHAPVVEDLPGEVLGTPSSGDAVVAVTYVEGGSRFADGDYLLVSPRTPYNRCILPAMNLSLSPDDRVVEDHGATVDVEAGHHYGFEVEDLSDVDEVEVTVETPPQVARHMGYETAFLEMESVTVSTPEER